MSHTRLTLIVFGVVLGCGGFPARSASVEIKTQIVEYRQGDVVGAAYLAYDDATRIMAAYDLLRQHPMVDASRMAVIGFIKEMRDARAAFDLELYGGGGHGYTNPANSRDTTKPSAYSEHADKRSWAAMRELFDEVFK